MIIKMTVHDNDFTGVMNGFLSQFYFNICFGVDASDFDWKRKNRFNEMLNPNCDKSLTDDDKTALKERIREAFGKYISNSKMEEDTKEYILKNLEISVQETFKDRWENGEAFYWLQHSGKIINQ